jgi:hypothetical protein
MTGAPVSAATAAPSVAMMVAMVPAGTGLSV